ncbi:hypothetical protein JOD31_000819 [Methylopila capsulata]|uniref:Uncharacterized protein n=1 Tax=Methylopila capsulata TaxID=61654 RepID=A0A9W6MSD0_9HYPH|nr:hypothetical protein [Methylopila capsulata]MBM7850607.1 hypothetical protein [Methylopila capsulata]GLK55901.1 hypothetical protein GCM10008170_19200 [Methylopila capsulata]
MTNAKIAAGFASLLIAASSTVAMAQATGKENNATSGSQPGVGPNSGPEVKGQSGMSGQTGTPGPAPMKDNTPTSAGTKDNKAEGLRGHSETPTTGK